MGLRSVRFVIAQISGKGNTKHTRPPDGGGNNPPKKGGRNYAKLQMIVCNTDDYSSVQVLCSGEVRNGTELVRIR